MEKALRLCRARIGLCWSIQIIRLCVRHQKNLIDLLLNP